MPQSKEIKKNVVRATRWNNEHKERHAVYSNKWKKDHRPPVAVVRAMASRIKELEDKLEKYEPNIHDDINLDTESILSEQDMLDFDNISLLSETDSVISEDE
jgi:hypothetical protein